MAEQKRSNVKANQPITRHPLFPAIVALWVGALLGLFSVAIPPSLTESFISALGIDKVLPMAAPPLGSTARLLIALVMTGIGIAAGAVLGRRLARSAEPVRSRRRATVPGSEAADEAPATPRQTPREPARSRRPLIVEPARPKRAEPQILDVAELDPADTAEANLAAEDAPLRIVRRSTLPPQVASTSFPLADADDETAPAGPASTAASLFEAYTRDIAAPANAVPAESPAIAETADFALDLQSIDEHDGEGIDDFAASAPAQEPADTPEEAGAMASEHFEAPRDNGTGRQAADRIVSAELDELSPLQLLERLALAMAHRQSLRDSAAPFAVAANQDQQSTDAVKQPVFVPLKALGPLLSAAEPARWSPPENGQEEAVEAHAAAPFAAPVVPAALRPVALDLDYDDGESDEPLPGYIPPRHIGMASVPETQAADFPAGFSAHDDDEEDETDAQFDDGYSSLLNMPRSMRSLPQDEQWFETEHATGDDHMAASVAPFPAHEEVQDELSGGDAQPGETGAAAPRPFDGPAGKAGAEDTEEALRAALATLQRMSGAA